MVPFPECCGPPILANMLTLTSQHEERPQSLSVRLCEMCWMCFRKPTSVCNQRRGHTFADVLIINISDNPQLSFCYWDVEFMVGLLKGLIKGPYVDGISPVLHCLIKLLRFPQ